MAKTRKRAHATSSVVITEDTATGHKTYEVDAATAEQLLTIPTEVVEEKAAAKGQGSNFRLAPKGESPSEIAQRKKRTAARIELPANGLPAETNPTASEMAQRHEQVPVPKYPTMLFPGVHRFEDSSVSGAVKPSDAHRIHAARKKRMRDSILAHFGRFALPVNERFAKSASVSEDQIDTLAEALTDENARSVHMPVEVLKAILGGLDDADVADRDLIRTMTNYVVFTQKAIGDLLVQNKAADDLPELLAVMREYKRVSESVIRGLLAERTARDVAPVEPVESVEVIDVKRAPLSLTDAEIRAIVDRVIGRGKTPSKERKMFRPVESYDEAVRLIEKSAAIAPRRRTRR